MEPILPLEIWEVILSNLPLQDLLRAACVCRVWRHLVTRLCRHCCQSLPPRLLQELQHEARVSRGFWACCSSTSSRPQSPSPLPAHDAACSGATDWLGVSRLAVQTHITSCPEHCTITLQHQRVSLVAAAGHFLVFVTRNSEPNERMVYLVDKCGRCTWKQPVDGQVYKVCVLEEPGQPSVLALCVSRALQCFLVADDLASLTPLHLAQEFPVDSRMSCDGYLLLVSRLSEEHQLAVYRAEVQVKQVHLHLQACITTTSPPVAWDLWNGFVTTSESGGHVSCYTKAGAAVGESRLYKDLRYPNPTQLTRGLVFSSTITSRALLSYWHMDRDRDYWLVGESVLGSWAARGAGAVGAHAHTPADEADGGAMEGSPVRSSPASHSSSCILTLAKVRIGAAMLLEVTTINYRRGLVFCGTNQGHVIVYRILGEGPPSQHQVNWLVMEKNLPSLSLALSQRPIARIAVFFTDTDAVIVAVDRDEIGYVVTVPNASHAGYSW